MPDPKDPRPGEVWERDGRQRVVDRVEGWPFQRHNRFATVTYSIGNRTHHAMRYVWTAWAKKATCIKEAADG